MELTAKIFQWPYLQKLTPTKKNIAKIDSYFFGTCEN